MNISEDEISKNMALPILRWDREKKKWMVSGDGKLLLKPEKKKSKEKRKEKRNDCPSCTRTAKL